MALDPICGMKVSEESSPRCEQDGEFFYFCGMHCLNQFVQNRNLGEKAVIRAGRSGFKWYKEKAILVGLALISMAAGSFLLPVLVPFRRSLLMYLGMIWWALLLGLLLGGMIDYFIPRKYISFLLGRPRKRTLLYSVLLGFLMSACSHGILALAVELYKKGASTAAVITFLLASPWANLVFTLLLIGFFGLKAFFFIVGAMLIAVLTGWMFQGFSKKGWVEANPVSKTFDDDFSVMRDMMGRVKAYRFSLDQLLRDMRGILEGTISLSRMVLWWILLGLGLASLAGAYIPQDFLRDYMGPTFSGTIVTLCVATVLEVCSEGTAPLTFELYRQTGAFGNAFVFLMAGVVTDYTEIGLIWINIGRKAAVWLPAVTVPQVLLLGILANRFF